MEANVGLGELQQKIKRLEGLCQVSELNKQLLLTFKLLYVSFSFCRLSFHFPNKFYLSCTYMCFFAGT